MEIVKELCISTADLDCYLTEPNSFHLKLNGFFNEISGPLYVSVKNITLPRYEKTIEFSLYYGPRAQNGFELRNFSTSYRSYEELACFITQCANLCITNKRCSNLDVDHDKHVCDGESESLFSLTYSNDRFVLVNGGLLLASYMTVMSADLARFLCFKDEVKRKLSSGQSYEDYSEPIRFDGGSFLSDGTTMLSDHMNRFCLVEFDSLINCRRIYSGVHSRILFTYDMLTNTAGREFGFKKLRSTDLSYLSFRLLTRDLKPYKFCRDLKRDPIMFSIQFLKKI